MIRLKATTSYFFTLCLAIPLGISSSYLPKIISFVGLWKTTDQNSVVGMNGPFMERQIDLLWRTFFWLNDYCFYRKNIIAGLY